MTMIEDEFCRTCGMPLIRAVRRTKARLSTEMKVFLVVGALSLLGGLFVAIPWLVKNLGGGDPYERLIVGRWELVDDQRVKAKDAQLDFGHIRSFSRDGYSKGTTLSRLTINGKSATSTFEDRRQWFIKDGDIHWMVVEATEDGEPRPEMIDKMMIDRILELNETILVIQEGTKRPERFKRLK